MAQKWIARAFSAVAIVAAAVCARPTPAWAAVSKTDTGQAIKVDYTGGGQLPDYADSISDLVGTSRNLGGEDAYGARTITLRADSALSDGIKVGCDVTLDLNGHTLAATASSSATERSVFSLEASGGHTLTVKDSGTGGSITSVGFNNIFRVAETDAKLVAQSGTYLLTSDSFAQNVIAVDAGSASVSGGSYVNLAVHDQTTNTAGPNVISTRGSATKVSVTGGLFANASPSAFAIRAEAGELEVDQAEGSTTRVVGGLGAVHVEGGTATFKGGTFESGVKVAASDIDGFSITAGTSTDDIALLVSSSYAANGPHRGSKATATVEGGTFSGSKALQVGTAISEPAEASTLELREGVFAGPLAVGTNIGAGAGLTIGVAPPVTYIGGATIDPAYADGFVLYSDGTTKLAIVDSAVSLSSAASSYVYDGAEKRPTVTVTLGGHVCSEGADYTLTYANNVNAGDAASVTVTAVAGTNYAGSITKYFSIAPKQLVSTGAGRNTVVTLEQSTMPYCELTNDSGVYYHFDPKVTVAVDANVVSPSNYEVTTTADPTSYAGTVTVTGKGNYTGSATVQCTVIKGVGVSFVDGFETAGNKLIAVVPVFPYSEAASTSTGSATPPAPPAHAGYAFAGWVGNYTTAAADTTVVAHYVADPNGTGIVVSFVDPKDNNAIIHAEAVASGGTATPPASDEVPAHEGYTFIGWSGTYSGVTASSTVTARYMAEGGHLVEFIDPLEDNKVIKSEHVADGDSATAPREDEMKEHPGYRHIGWDKEFSKVEEDLRVIATYEQVLQYTVTFVDSMDNDKTIKSETVNRGSDATPPDAADVPTHEGYNFAGWDGEYTKVTADVMVRTKWEKQPDPAQPNAGDMAVLTTETLPDGTKRLRLLDGNGKPATGWLLVGGKWYIADDEGYARTGLYNVGTVTYVLGSDGTLQLGWIYAFDVNAWMYANPGTTGTYAAVVKGEWFWDGDGWYLASSTGPIRSGWVEDEATNVRYHLNDGTNGTFGKLDTERWILDNGSWYWLGATGVIQGDWQWIEGDWYYLNPEEGRDYGKLKTGWFWDGKRWYWTNYSGKLLRNRWVYSSGAWYYLGADGSMRTGWAWIDGAWYYFGWNGAMYALQMTPDGCLTGADGKWMG